MIVISDFEVKKFWNQSMKFRALNFWLSPRSDDFCCELHIYTDFDMNLGLNIFLSCANWKSSTLPLHFRLLIQRIERVVQRFRMMQVMRINVRLSKVLFFQSFAYRLFAIFSRNSQVFDPPSSMLTLNRYLLFVTPRKENIRFQT